MPFARGLALIASFSLAWGALTGMNAALLRWVGGVSWGILPFAGSLALGLLEALTLLVIVDRCFLRGRQGAPLNGMTRGLAKDAPAQGAPGQEGAIRKPGSIR